MEDGKSEQDRSGRYRQHDADRVNDAVGYELGSRIVEAPGERNLDTQGCFTPFDTLQRVQRAAIGLRSDFSSARWIASLPATIVPPS